MKEVFDVLIRLSLIGRMSPWVRWPLLAVLLACTGEAAQSGLLGSPSFWIAARVVPWPPLLEPVRVVSTAYSIRLGTGSWAMLPSSGLCPIGSQLEVKFQRSADGWAAVAGWNSREGLYQISRDGILSEPVEKDRPYPFQFKMNSSAGREYMIVLGSSKPFDARRSLSEVATLLKTTSARWVPELRGGVPELSGLALDHIEVGHIGSCIS